MHFLIKKSKDFPLEKLHFQSEKSKDFSVEDRCKFRLLYINGGNQLISLGECGMSRIGRMPIAIPAGVTVDIAENNKVTVKGS